MFVFVPLKYLQYLLRMLISFVKGHILLDASFGTFAVGAGSENAPTGVEGGRVFYWDRKAYAQPFPAILANITSNTSYN
jgi:hypothetical protein